MKCAVCGRECPLSWVNKTPHTSYATTAGTVALCSAACDHAYAEQSLPRVGALDLSFEPETKEAQLYCELPGYSTKVKMP